MMLVSTPTKHYISHLNPTCDMSPSYQRKCTPPRLCSDSTSYDSPMLTPSPFRRTPLFSSRPTSVGLNDPDDLFSQSPFRTPALAHSFNPKHSAPLPQPIPADDEEGSIFLSKSSHSFSPFFATSNSQSLRTPVKPGHQASSRAALSIVHLNRNPTQYSGPGPVASNPPVRVGVGTKRKSTPQSTPLRAHALTPLKLAASPEGTFSGGTPLDRLAPLPAPKFTTQTPQTKAETEAHLKKHTATLTRLKITDKNSSDDEFSLRHDSGCERDDDDEAVADDGKALFLSKNKARLKTGSYGKAAARSLANKGKEKEEVVEAVSPGGHITKRRARSRPVSAELIERSLKLPKSPTRVTSNSSANRPLSTGPITFPSAHRGNGSPGSSSPEAGSPLPRRRISTTASRSLRGRPSLTRVPLSRVESATLFFGPLIPPRRERSLTNTNDGLNVVPSPMPLAKVNRHSYAGTGSGPSFAPIQPWGATPEHPSARTVPGSPEDEDADMFFSSGPADSSFVFSVTEGTPSPQKTQSALPRKFKLRDSGVVVSDEEEGFLGLSFSGRIGGEHERGVSGGGGDVIPAMPRISTSVSSIASDADDGLVTPGVGPEYSAGWPTTDICVDTDVDPQVGVNVDEFIVRTLSAAAKHPGTGTGEEGKKRVPGTPVKKIRTGFLGGERLWQSAVATKVGPRVEWVVGAPRKSLPAVIAAQGRIKVGGKRRGRNGGDSTESEGEEDSPSSRRERERQSLGLGRPSLQQGLSVLRGSAGLAAFPRNKLLMRRSSSGAFSSGSESPSVGDTPTRVQGVDWKLPRIPLSNNRSASGSSTSTVHSPTRRPASHINLREAANTRRRSDHLPERLVVQHTGRFPEEQPGRFERDFLEVDEVGSGQFGRVLKVRRKMGGDQEVFAVKKSKRFEGTKHRLRLREEVDILKHLSKVAQSASADGRHPNVLAYIDSWEEDEALYIQTELCESGNLARFLWEYGRAFPRLDEARVWKIVADLSNGLRFIHDAGVIHLDLKPANVFVTKEGKFKIGDFGMASLWPRPAAGEGFEREGDKLYLAPEVLQGRYGMAADVFSFGMTVLETASNIVVPDQGDAWHRLRQEDFSQVDLEESPELLELVWCMMRADPTLRMTAHQVCAHPVVARASASMEREYAKSQRERRSVFSASPLAAVPDGFLEEILGRRRVVSDTGAMDLSA